jgi:hypothetical protein
MPEQLKVGDRVRVTAGSRTRGYQPGDTGTVLEGPSPYAGGGGAVSYVVAMDKDGPSRTSVVFNADEVEPDR